MSSNDDNLAAASDARLMALSQDHPAAFAELYRRYALRIFRYLYFHTGNNSDAQDLTARVFIAAWEGRKHYQERGSFPAWLFSIARNKAADHHRRSQQPVSFEELEAARHDESDLLEALIQSEAQELLEQLVARLEPKEKELLRLRFAGELTYAQMGAVLEMSEDAVKMAMHRLLHRLREAWKECDG